VRAALRASMVWAACLRERRRALWERVGEGLMEPAALRALCMMVLGWVMEGRL